MFIELYRCNNLWDFFFSYDAGTLSASEITDIMDLKRLTPNHPWYVQPTQGNSGVGLHDAFKVLARMVKQFHKELSKAELLNRQEGGPDATEV